MDAKCRGEPTTVSIELHPQEGSRDRDRSLARRLLRTDIEDCKPSLLHLIDPWRLATDLGSTDAWYGSGKSNQNDLDRNYAHVLQRFSERIKNGTVVVHRLPSGDRLQSFDDDAIDFVYIDGDHRYEGVLSDLTNALRVVKRGGLICGDDYELGGWWRDGVVRALHDFVSGRPVVIEMLIGSQFILRKL